MEQNRSWMVSQRTRCFKEAEVNLSFNERCLYPSRGDYQGVSPVKSVQPGHQYYCGDGTYNKFVNSDGQWLFVILQNYDLLTHLLSNLSSPRSVCCEAAIDKKDN